MSDRPPADPDLVAAIQGGDLTAFEAFYRTYEASVYRTALALTRDRMIAEEVVVDTFLRAYAARERLDPARSPLPWLQRVAVNLSLNRLKRRHFLPERLETIEAALMVRRADDGLSPDRISERREMTEVLIGAVARLPAQLRAVIVLRYLHEYSLAAIAEILECPVGTVKSRHYHALRALRGYLQGAPATADSLLGPAASPAVERSAPDLRGAR